MDMLIAAVALANDAILVTHNTKHFENIDGLVLEDWLT
jgi:predicted nucleic acid-binding protein